MPRKGTLGHYPSTTFNHDDAFTDRLSELQLALDETGDYPEGITKSETIRLAVNEAWERRAAPLVIRRRHSVPGLRGARYEAQAVDDDDSLVIHRCKVCQKRGTSCRCPTPILR